MYLPAARRPKYICICLQRVALAHHSDLGREAARHIRVHAVARRHELLRQRDVLGGARPVRPEREHACVYVHVRTCMHTYTHTYVYVCYGVYVRASVRRHVRVRVRVRVHV